MARTVPPRARLGGPAPTARASTSDGRLGLPGATALVVGTIVGVGIFNLPTALAGYGPISIVSMALTTAGALALGGVFAALARRMPAEGGPYAYARLAFGNRHGFVNAWSYWITGWAGNAAIAVGWVLYVEVFVNTGHDKLWSIALVLAGLWAAALLNLSGVRNMGAFQVASTTLKFGALAFVSIVGLFHIDGGNYTPWNVSGESAIDAIGGGMAIALFSYLGLETASVAAAKVRDPDRNVPRATMLGTLASAVVYMLSLIAVFGVLPADELAGASAPFSAVVDSMFGGTAGGDVMAAVVIVSGMGALNGWTMVAAEVPHAAAKDGLFPERFTSVNRRGAPAFAIVASTALASLAVLVNYLGADGSTVFTTLVLMTGVTAAIPYAFSAAAQIKWRVADHRRVETPRFARDVIVAGLALVFSLLFIWFSRNTAETSWLYWAPYLMAAAALALGIPVYRKQRARMVTPGEVPPYR
jgi:APA family basic amino acid/polyamine antiporter